MKFGYHITPLKNLSKIAQAGLEPRIGDRSSRLGEVEPGVYLFHSKEMCEDALMNWMADEFTDEEIVILKVNLTGLSTRIGADYEIIITSRIDNRRISAVYDEKWGLISGHMLGCERSIEAEDGTNLD